MTTMTTTHAHRWRIAEPDGRKQLPGVCRLCGEVRLFKAAEELFGFKDMDDMRLSGELRPRGGVRYG